MQLKCEKTYTVLNFTENSKETIKNTNRKQAFQSRKGKNIQATMCMHCAPQRLQDCSYKVAEWEKD